MGKMGKMGKIGEKDYSCDTKRAKKAVFLLKEEKKKGKIWK
jgi:hypothetical protein